MSGSFKTNVHSTDINARIHHGKFRNIVTVSKDDKFADFNCADAVYGGDDAACIQAAIDYCAAHSIIELWIFDGTYTISTQITGTSDINIRGFGNVIFSSSPVSATSPEILSFSGTLKSTISCTSDISIGVCSLSVSESDSAYISPGDLLLIYDNTLWGDSVQFPSLKTGELHEVISISGTTVNFIDGVIHSYTMGNNLCVQVITPITISISNILLQGHSSILSNGLIYLMYTKNSMISECELKNGGMYGINIHNSMNTKIKLNTISNFEMSGYGAGVDVNDASAHSMISDNTISGCRHCIASGGYGLIGEPRDIRVSQNTLFGGSESIIDAHDCVESIYAIGNTIHGTFSPTLALSSGAKISIFRGNEVYNSNGAGIRGYTKNILYTVENNHFYHCSYAYQDATVTTRCTVSRANIINNHMHDTLEYLIYAIVSNEIMVVGNTIDKSTNYQGMYLKNINTGIIANNIISSSYRNGIYLSGCANVTVIDNQILNSNGINQSGEGYESGLALSSCNNINVNHNIITDLNTHQRYAIAEYGTSDNNKIENNTVSGAIIKPILKVGAATVVKNNDGYTTENTGSATLLLNTTSITVSHGLAATPTRVQITPTSSTQSIGYFVSAKAATTFTITMLTAPTVDVTFDWRAEV